MEKFMKLLLASRTIEPQLSFRSFYHLANFTAFIFFTMNSSNFRYFNSTQKWKSSGKIIVRNISKNTRCQSTNTSLHCVSVFFHENDLIENLAPLVAGLISADKYLKYNQRDFILFSISRDEIFHAWRFCFLVCISGNYLAIIPFGENSFLLSHYTFLWIMALV